MDFNTQYVDDPTLKIFFHVQNTCITNNIYTQADIEQALLIINNFINTHLGLGLVHQGVHTKYQVHNPQLWMLAKIKYGL